MGRKRGWRGKGRQEAGKAGESRYMKGCEGERLGKNAGEAGDGRLNARLRDRVEGKEKR